MKSQTWKHRVRESSTNRRRKEVVEGWEFEARRVDVGERDDTLVWNGITRWLQTRTNRKNPV